MEKVTISTEISRDAFGMVAQLAGTEIDSELWEKLTAAPIQIDIKDVDDREAQIGLVCVLAGLALAKVSKNG